ncbi:uncharacterized protein LAJ45_04790 [Morchella importuna]|uniref:uncharacterized protein n=1 Tax=Morchella importuna TaxID=1174673 RepID=UPI001E8E4428|nr:uncharacterized protein LAJ45_04790 [Morchella importuna]KAH8151088.1 hypothetical protein LAJ45_04790 [Morchella importuna]
MSDSRPPNLMVPASLDAASPVSTHAHGSPSRLSSDAATRLHQTVEADTDTPSQPLRQKTSSLRLATAAARGMVKGLFNIGGKLSAAGSSEHASPPKSPSTTSLVSANLSVAESEEEEEYIYNINDATGPQQLPPLEGGRGRRFRPVLKRKVLPVEYTDFPPFDPPEGSERMVAPADTETPSSSRSSSRETILNVGPLERKGSWRGKYNYRRVRQMRSDTSDSGRDNINTPVKVEPKIDKQEQKPPKSPASQKLPQKLRSRNLNTTEVASSSPSPGRKRNISSRTPSAPRAVADPRQRPSSPASILMHAPPPSRCTSTSSLPTLIYEYAPLMDNSSSTSINSNGQITSLSPVTYKLPVTDGYVSFPPFISRNCFSRGASRLGRILGGNRNASTSSLPETLEDNQSGFRRTLRYLEPLKRRSGSISTFGTNFENASIAESIDGVSVAELNGTLALGR